MAGRGTRAGFPPVRPKATDVPSCEYMLPASSDDLVCVRVVRLAMLRFISLPVEADRGI